MKRIACVCAALTVALTGLARAQDRLTQTARQVLDQNKDAVVWVSAVVKVQAGGLGINLGPAQEQKLETLGTVIDPSGLVVLSNTMLNPTSLVGNMEVTIGGETKKIEMKAEVSDVKIRLAEGQEIAAKLVLKDPDLDLAFVMPEKPLKDKLPAVKLDKAPDAKALDDVICLGRLGQSLDRQPTVALAKLSAVVRKPRTFYTSIGFGSPGIPVFCADGKLLGIHLLRQGTTLGDGAGLLSLAASGGIATVVLPAEDVDEIAKQALAKKDEKPTTGKSD